MSILELLPEQHVFLADHDTVRAVDPRTKTAYVIMREEVYDRLKNSQYDDSPWTNVEMEQLAIEAGEMLDRYQP